VSDLRRQNEKKAAIFKNKYNRSFDYSNTHIRSMAQKGNDLLIRNQNLMDKKAANGQQPIPQQPKPTKIPQVTPQNPYKKTTERVTANHQEANIFQTVTEATTRGVNKSVVSDTGGQITFNHGTGNGGSLKSAGGRTGKRCIFMTGSEFGGMTDVGEGRELVKDEGESVVTGNDVWGKEDEVESRGVAKTLERSSSII
jgi:type II secretory pathway pseudopilin PulG